MILEQHYAPNINGTDYVVGDIHGKYDLLMSELRKVNFNFSKDRLFGVGDLIDRGEDSYKCLCLLSQEWFKSTLGNHEQLMLDPSFIHIWLSNGGEWSNEFDKEDLNFLRKKICELMPMYITLEHKDGRKIGLCHAQPPVDWNEKPKYVEGEWSATMWGRDKINYNEKTPCENIDLTVHGHTPVKEVKKIGNSVFLDTHAYYTNKLTVMSLENLLDLV